MFDTHCHLNFSRFKHSLPEVVKRAREAGVTQMVIPGTDVATSQKALEIASQYEGLYAAVGIHPHHAHELKTQNAKLKTDIEKIASILSHEKVVAVGEIGLDRHEYKATKYEEYAVDDSFLELQRQLFAAQLQLAVKHKKSVILHNREAKADMLAELTRNWSAELRGRTVLHCCEPDAQLLKFAQNHGIYIGVDGDITYYPEKQAFIKAVPLTMLVLETDAPFLLPEPLRTQKKYPNEPANLSIIAQFIADLRGMSVEELQNVTTANAQLLFQL